MPELALKGCTATPLGSYLKALGLFRVVARQADSEARGWWRADTFWLRSRLDADELVDFLVNHYRPTPAVSPWNGASGFYPKDARQGIERIEASVVARLDDYRTTIAAGRAAVAASTGPPSGARKERLLSLCRATFPDEALDWLDCAVCFTSRGLQFPPLLVTGGNDGHLEFSNNFMQRLCDVLPELGESRTFQPGLSERWLRAALFGGLPEGTQLREVSGGLFDPGAAGGANATAGFKGESLVNPWDFVLMIEGLVLFGAAAARRLGRVEGPATVAFPFTVQPSAAGARWGASELERVKAEVWMPLWSAPTTLSEVRHLCGEGRAEWRGRQVGDAVDFAKAIAALGVSRGLDAFVRYGLSTRMGRNHLAVPLRRVPVRRRPEVDLLAAIDPWLRRVRGLGELPARLASALNQMDRASFELCIRGGSRAAQEVLIELTRVELRLAANPQLANQVEPLELDLDWVHSCNDGSPEYRLAAAIASLGHPDLGPLRSHVEPVTVGRGGRLVRGESPSRVWAEGPGARNLAAVFQRRLLDAAMRGSPGTALAGAWSARAGDVDQLLAGMLDVERLAELLAALAMVRRWSDRRDVRSATPSTLPRAYGLLKLCLLPFPVERRGLAIEVPMESGIAAALAAGRVLDAVRLGAARLRASGLPPHRAAEAEELAAGLDPGLLEAALLAPISPASAAGLLELICPSSQME